MCYWHIYDDSKVNKRCILLTFDMCSNVRSVCRVEVQWGMYLQCWEHIFQEHMQIM